MGVTASPSCLRSCTTSLTLPHPPSPRHQANFDATYDGNRSPMPIYIHTPWLTTAHIADLKKFAGECGKASVGVASGLLA